MNPLADSQRHDSLLIRYPWESRLANKRRSADRWFRREPKPFGSLVRPWGGSGLIVPRLQHDLGVWRSSNEYYTIVATNLLRPFLC